jgi:hypothetical protein
MKELQTFRKYLAEGKLLKENALEKLADITFETAEEDKGSAAVYIDDFEDNEDLFNKAYDMINQGTTSLSSGKFDYKFSAHKDKDGDKFIKLSFKMN